VIRVPHHGGEIRHFRQTWTQFGELYDAVAAKHAVVSVGTNNGHRHPAADHVLAMSRGGACRVACTQITPRCHPRLLDLRDRALELAAGVEPAYRHHVRPGEVPCAGTIVTWIEPSGAVRVLPEPDGWHLTEMVQRAEHPLCRPSPATAVSR